jgi:hypothetical protein
MAQTLCIKCGSELKVSSHCQLCMEPLIFTCTSCGYVTEEKVHTDCRNAAVLAKTAKTISMPTFISTTANQQESIVDKIKQEKIDKVEIRSAPSYMKSKEDNGKNINNNINPFTAGTAAWQSLMTYWLHMYGVGFKNALKMTEEWYNIFYKPWVNWMPRQPKSQNRY